MTLGEFIAWFDSMMEFTQVEVKLQSVGLISRGGFHPLAEDQVPAMAGGLPVGTVILAGNAGSEMWYAFQRARAKSGRQLTLDAWTENVLSAVAQVLGAEVLFPFGGPPFLPFQRWAQRAEAVFPSPIGPLIHTQYGLWHAYRGALLFDQQLDLPVREAATSPCETCSDRPCLSTCPVGALTQNSYDVSACRGHLLEVANNPCLAGHCLARHACPVGRDFRYSAEQAHFHMHAFSRTG